MTNENQASDVESTDDEQTRCSSHYSDAFEPVESLPVKVIQIQCTGHPGDYNSGPHTAIYSLCEDGSIWVQYHASPNSNVPNDGKWRIVNKPTKSEIQSTN